MAKQWMPLDTAALIFPAVRKERWVNAFRVSATLTEPVDPVLLQQAVEDLAPRFPSLYVKLRHGLFWYYLEEAPAPAVRQDYAYPLTFMSKKELSACCLRVLYFENRIAVEFFHSLTDGNGGMVYLKTLTARYLERKQALSVSPAEGVLDWREKPRAEELEDSFFRHSSKYALGRGEPNSYRLRGTPETGFLHLTTGILPADRLVAAAHAQGATVTVFLAAVMAQVLLEKQQEEVPPARQRPVKITVPVNLRKLYGSTTLRNFVLTLNPGVDPRLGTYTLRELCDVIAAQLKAEATPQRMAGRIAANVNPQKAIAMKLVPLFIKNWVLRAIYFSVGERKGCLNVSNLGLQRLPEELVPWVERLEFIVGVQSSYPNNCSVVTYKGFTYINMIRNIVEPDLERRFFSRLVELHVPVSIESNERS